MKIIGLVLSIFLVWIEANIANAKRFNLASDIWYPFFYFENEQPTGLSVDIIKEVMGRAGHEVEFSYFPNRRLRFVMELGKVDGVLLDSPLWVNDKEKEASVFTNSLFSIKEYAYRKKSSKGNFSNPRDFLGYNVGMNAGYVYDAFEPFFQRDQIHKFEIDGAERLVNLLRHDRVDTFFMDEYLYGYLLKQNRILHAEFKPVFKLSETELAFRFHQNVEEYVIPFNKIIREMIGDGFIDQVISRYSLREE